MKASMKQVIELTDCNSSKQVWIAAPHITCVRAMQDNQYVVHLACGTEIGLNQANFDILKTVFEAP